MRCGVFRLPKMEKATDRLPATDGIDLSDDLMYEKKGECSRGGALTAFLAVKMTDGFVVTVVCACAVCTLCPNSTSGRGVTMAQ